MIRSCCALVLTGLLLAALSCGESSETSTRRTVSVAAASDLRFALPEIEAAFERAHPDTDLVASYGSSGSFFAQILQNAPYDVFLSADAEYPQKLVEAGRAEPSFPYAVGQVALIVPKDSALDIERLGLSVLQHPTVKKIATANPAHAPYGRAAMAALDAFGADAEVRAKLVSGDNVAQAAQFVETGAAEVGLVALSLAVSAALKAKTRHVVIPISFSPGLSQRGVVLRAAENLAGAARFAAFLSGAEARQILVRNGYGTDF